MLRAGLPVAVGEILGRHRAALIAFLRKRLRNREEAEEVAQEACVRLLQQEGIERIDHLRAYFFRTAINIATDRARAKRRHSGGAGRCAIEEVQLIDEAPSAERQIAADQELEQMYRIIEQLPPRCRQVFLLSRVHHMTYAQIAAHCGISVKMVEKHVGHALSICFRQVGGSR